MSEPGHQMALEIVVRSRPDGERSPKTNHHDRLAPPAKAADQPKPANDNDEAWPLIPFPDGWYG
jgi:hypothetical protein